MADEGDALLAAMIARVQAFGKDATRDAAREAAPLVEAVVKASAAAGTDPYGNAWPTKRDGSRALPNAADGVTAEAGGPVIRVRVRGPYAIHHFKKVDGRQVLPSGDKPLPRAIVAALTEGAARAWRKAMGG